MAGTGWKAIGTILIVIGGLGVVVGVGGAAFGGALFAGAISDASDCGGFLNPCDRDIEERGEAGMTIAAFSGAVAVGGFALVIAGIVLVFVGISRAKSGQPGVMP